jgi:hypothetical protein
VRGPGIAALRSIRVVQYTKPLFCLSVRQVQGHLVGPVGVLAALRAWLGPGARPGGGLVPGLQRGAGCTAGLAREAATATGRRWRSGGRWGCRACHEALGIYTHDVHRRWGSVFWRSCWARVIRGRLPVIGRPNQRRHPSARPAARVRARPRGCWRGGGVPWPQVHPRRRARQRGAGRHARRQACERRGGGRGR